MEQKQKPGKYFGLETYIVAEKYTTPLLMKFKLSGFGSDANTFIQKIEQYANKEVDFTKQ